MKNCKDMGRKAPWESEPGVNTKPEKKYIYNNRVNSAQRKFRSQTSDNMDR
jgi:hypothetical protein